MRQGILVVLFGVLTTEALFIGDIRKQTACSQNHGSSSLVCPATNTCFNPDKQTCCPLGYLADVPSLYGVCCGSEVFNTKTVQMNELTCRTPKQNYAFCNRRKKRNPMSKSPGDPCKQNYANTIVITEQIESKGFNVIYNGTIRPRRWLDTGSSPGNQTVIRIVTDRWMPCKDRLTGDDRFLVFSNTSFEIFVRGNFYLNPNDIIFPIHRGSKMLRSLRKRCSNRSKIEKTFNEK